MTASNGKYLRLHLTKTWIRTNMMPLKWSERWKKTPPESHGRRTVESTSHQVGATGEPKLTGRKRIRYDIISYPSFSDPLGSVL